MILDQTSATKDATDATAETGNQAQAEKFYTQREVNDMMAGLKASVSKKALKPYEDLGDPDELRRLKSEAEQRNQDQQIKRGEFEKTLQDLAAKKDQEIQKRDSIIKEYKVNSPLVSAAAKYRAVNADQVRSLLSNDVRLNNDGEVEVIDAKGSVRYKDTGAPLQVEDLVREFLDSNPHFVSATPATTNSRSNVTNNMQSEVDVTKLDMRLKEHRQVYANLQKNKKS